MELVRGAHIGPYRVRNKISEGGMAVLYAAELREKYRKQGRARQVVLKVAKHEREAFVKEEADFLRRMKHPGIVRIYPLPTPAKDQWVANARTPTGNSPYMALEYVGGGTLEERLVLQKRLPVQQVVSIGLQLAQALHHAHSQGIINRDVKPGNVLFRHKPGAFGWQRPQVVLCDFGIALDRTRPGAGEVRAGTFAYMSPEQVYSMGKDSVQIGPESDIYALGVVLYEMLTGRTPFGDDVARIIDPQDVAPRPSSLRPGIPAALDRIVLRAMKKNAHERYHTAQELADELARVPYQVDAGFVATRLVLFTWLFLVMAFAWQLGVALRDGSGPRDETPPAPTEQLTAAPVHGEASPTATLAATEAPTRLSPTATSQPTATRRRPTSTPITPTATRPPPTVTPRPSVTPTPLPQGLRIWEEPPGWGMGLAGGGKGAAGALVGEAQAHSNRPNTARGSM